MPWVRLTQSCQMNCGFCIWSLFLSLCSLLGQNTCHQVKWMWKTFGPRWRQRWLSRWLFLLASPSQSLMPLLLLLSSLHWWEEQWWSIQRRTRTCMHSQCQVMAQVVPIKGVLDVLVTSVLVMFNIKNSWLHDTLKVMCAEKRQEHWGDFSCSQATLSLEA